ncbi:MAG: hypothetical protein DRG78_03120 [Epsilonproteobacteria bacterium]|nr:MAG: hypothetical protein DRG78_03120 [Campylobacterota bacterium]
MTKRFELFLFFILSFSFMHAVLRLSSTSPISLYRIFIPIILLIFMFQYKKSLIPFMILSFLLLYNFLLTYFYCGCYKHYIQFSFHYISIFTIFLIVYYLLEKIKFSKIYNFMYSFLIFMLIIAIFEIIFNFRLPNVALYYDGSVSAFNWTQNEFTTAQLGFIPFLLVLEKRLYIKIPLITFILYLSFFINDSKIGFIGIFIAIIIYILKSFFIKNKYIKLIVLGILILLIPILIIIPYNEIIIHFRNDEISLFNLFIDPIIRIFTFTPYLSTGGSIFDRVDGAIYAIINLIDSNMFGIGIGNTYTMLQTDTYKLATAESIHNLPLQLIVENGIFMLFVMIYLIYYFLKLLWKQTVNEYEMIQLIAIPSFLIGSLSSSGGIFSNYYFIVCTILIILLNNKVNQNLDIGKNNEIKK